MRWPLMPRTPPSCGCRRRGTLSGCWRSSGPGSGSSRSHVQRRARCPLRRVNSCTGCAGAKQATAAALDVVASSQSSRPPPQRLGCRLRGDRSSLVELAQRPTEQRAQREHEVGERQRQQRLVRAGLSTARPTPRGAQWHGAPSAQGMTFGPVTLVGADGDSRTFVIDLGWVTDVPGVVAGRHHRLGADDVRGPVRTPALCKAGLRRPWSVLTTSLVVRG